MKRLRRESVVEYPIVMWHRLWLYPESQISGFRIRNNGLREVPLSDGGMLVEASKTLVNVEWAGGVNVNTSSLPLQNLCGRLTAACLPMLCGNGDARSTPMGNCRCDSARR